jgi:hypothetical protein
MLEQLDATALKAKAADISERRNVEAMICLSLPPGA